MTELVERDGALAAIATSLRLAREGCPGVLAIVGEAGLGKTTLLERCVEQAREFLVARVSCTDVESSIPFGAFDRLMRRAGLKLLLPRDAEGRWASGSPGDARVLRYEQLLEWLATPAERPRLLAIDDLHWADADSLQLLALMCRQVEELPVGVVATMRPYPEAAVERWRALEHEGMAGVEWLRPLSDAGGTELLGRLLGSAPDEGKLSVAIRAAAGNPLLLGECAAALARGEDLDLLGARDGGVFLSRFAGVGAAASGWARAASVLGSRFRPSVVAEVAGQTEPEAMESLRTLCAAGLVRAAGAVEAEFVHPLVQQSLYDGLAPLVRQTLHAAAFKTLSRRGAEAEELLPHALNADLSGDASAASMLAAAGERALNAGAVATASTHLARAVESSPTTAGPGLRLMLVQACLATGDLVEAEAAVLRTLQLPGLAVGERVHSLRLLAQAQLASARFAEAKRTAARASALVAGSDPALAAEILLDSAFVGWLFEGVYESRRTLAGIEGKAGVAVAESIRAADAHLVAIGGDAADVEVLAAAAEASMLDHDQHVRTPWRWDVPFGWANVAKILERFEESDRLFTRLAAMARAQGAAVTLHTLNVNHADLLWRIGRLQEAKSLLLRSVEISALVPTLAPFSFVGLAHIDHEIGDEEASARWEEQVRRRLESSDESPYLGLWLHLFDCRRRLAAGDAAGASRAADGAARLAARSGILEPCVVPWHASAIEAYLAGGEIDRAEEHSRWLAELCAGVPCRAPTATARAGLASVAWRRGDDGGAYRGFREALELHEERSVPLAEAEVLLAFGRFCRHSSRRAEARAVLGRAVQLTEPIGAHRIREQLERELVLAGGRRRRRLRPGELTPQEHRVAGLAATGLTSPAIARELFVSVKTVDHHLSRVYAKLGISSRRDLIRTWPSCAGPASAGPASAGPGGSAAPAGSAGS